MLREDFLSVYHNTSVSELSEFYEETSVFDEMTSDGQWTEPLIGADRIVGRLVELELVGSRWPIEICQQIQSDGILVVLASVNGCRRQILILHQSTAAKNPSGMVVCNHLYLTTASAANIDDEESFRQNFERWAKSLDNVTRKRAWMAFHSGVSFVVNHYASVQARRSAGRNKKHGYSYSNNSWFSFRCNDKNSNNHVCKGAKSIRKQYNSLAVNYQRVSLRAIKTYWCVTSPKALNTKTVVLVEGVVPEVPGLGRSSDRKFVQLFVIDRRTQTILNDVLFFEPRQNDAGSRRRTASPFDWTRDEADGQLSDSSNSLCRWSSDGSVSSTSSGSLSDSDDEDLTEDAHSVASTALRLRMASSLLEIRGMAKTAPRQQQHNGHVTNVNPRQLFIGCVPLHVKYGQLKLLFERFGEVTYVKVYEGYSKQTGAKMFHNYAFLFFKDEASVDKAIAASPVPLDSTWSLNVSRPHHHHTSSSTPTSRF